MKQSPREVAMGLATQAELLPKLRDNLLEIVNRINLALNDGKARGHGAPRKIIKGLGGLDPSSVRVGVRNDLGKRRGKKKQPKAKFLDAMPPGAMAIAGIHQDYRFVPGLGILSSVNGRVRLLITPGKKSSWTVRTPSGGRLFIGRAKLQERLGIELGL